MTDEFECRLCNLGASWDKKFLVEQYNGALPSLLLDRVSTICKREVGYRKIVLKFEVLHGHNLYYVFSI